jgi:hypothetical protein
MSEIDAKTALMDFLHKMSLWEREHFIRLSEALEAENVKLAREIKEEAKHQLRVIFDEHCVPGKAGRRRIISSSLKSPTTYDTDRDNLSLDSQRLDKVVYIYQQVGGLDTRLRFTMVICSSVWKILKAEYYSVADSKWIVWTL